MARELRPYQREAVAAIEQQWQDGANRTVAVLSTGLGKTDLIADIATRRAAQGQRGLILAHRAELCDQITQRCQMHAPSIPIGRVQASQNETRRPITVAMAPTLATAKRRARMRPPDFVIIDECHHAASPSYMSIMQWAGCFDRLPTLGVTATLTRGDKRGLGDVWQSVAFERGIPWAVENEWLVRPRGRVVVTDHMDLERAKISKGDFQDNELGEMVEQDVDQIVKAWLEHAADRITVAFTPSVSSGQALAAAFADQGIPVGQVYGTTPMAERNDIYADLGAGRLRVLVSVMVTTEGWDCPPVSCVLMARPTRLPGLYTQIVGRGLRPSPGKVDCLVLDVVGASRRQRLVSLVDLLPSAEIDSSELDDLPCEGCLCSPADCQCDREPSEGSAEVATRRLFGPALYEDIELFSGSTCNWLFTHRGLRFLPAGDRIAVLWPLRSVAGADQSFSIGHCSSAATLLDYADGRWLDDEVPHTLEEAKHIAERWALEYAPEHVTRMDAKRHARAPLAKDVARWAGVIPGAEAMTRGRLADEVDVRIASRLLDQGVA